MDNEQLIKEIFQEEHNKCKAYIYGQKVKNIIDFAVQVLLLVALIKYLLF